MGIALRVFRLVRATGAGGCTHFVLLRAGQPSYPNADQTAADAAEDLYESTLANLTRWWERWWLPNACRGTGHSTAVVGETDDEGVIRQEHTEPVVDLDRHEGMRLVDVWVAGSGTGSMAVGLAPDAAAFWTALEADLPDRAARLRRPERALQVLLLTDHSGAGDLRNT